MKAFRSLEKLQSQFLHSLNKNKFYFFILLSKDAITMKYSTPSVPENSGFILFKEIDNK